MKKGVDIVGHQPPFTTASVVLPIFVCFRFPSGALYAGPVDSMFRFNPELIMQSDVSFRSHSDALRWAVTA